MSKHTPGPWVITPGLYGPAIFQDTPLAGTLSGRLVCDVFQRPCEPDTTTADARLIAAAPDLLGLLEELLENGTCFYSAIELDHDFDGEAWGERVRAIIAKAEGES